METYLKIITVIIAVFMVSTGVALGFSEIGITTASSRQAQTIQDAFGVELLILTAADGTQIPVIRTESGDYIDATSFIQAYHGDSRYAIIYKIENGSITGEQTSVLTFSDGGRDPADIKNKLGLSKLNA